MIISVNMQGGFGNTLHMFCTAIFLAHKFNKKIHINWHYNIHDSDKKRVDTRSSLKKIMKNSDILTVAPASRHIITITTYEECTELYARDNVPQDIILNCILGFPFKFYYDNIDLLKKYIDFDNIQPPIKITENDIALSFRLGMGSSEVSPDAYAIYHKIPTIYYEQILDSIDLSGKRLLICADNFNNTYLNFLNKYNIEKIYCDYNTIDQFSILKNTNIFISSNSSFSLWAGIVSNATTIYYPQFKNSGGVNNNEPVSVRFYPYTKNAIYIPF